MKKLILLMLIFGLVLLIPVYANLIFPQFNTSNSRFFLHDQYSTYSPYLSFDNDTTTYAWAQQGDPELGNSYIGINLSTNNLTNVRYNMTQFRIRHSDTVSVNFEIRAANNCTTTADPSNYNIFFPFVLANVTEPAKDVWYEHNVTNYGNYSCIALFPSLASGWIKYVEWELYYSNPIVTAGTSTCTCPTSGDWQIADGSVCNLTTSCDLGTNTLRIDNGAINLAVSTSLTAGKCIVSKSLGKITGFRSSSKLICKK